MDLRARQLAPPAQHAEHVEEVRPIRGKHRQVVDVPYGRDAHSRTESPADVGGEAGRWVALRRAERGPPAVARDAAEREVRDQHRAQAGQWATLADAGGGVEAVAEPVARAEAQVTFAQQLSQHCLLYTSPSPRD